MKVNVNSQSKLNLMQRSLGIKFNICRRNGNLQEIDVEGVNVKKI